MALLELICLANARKRSERCVACLRADGEGLIRLVSNAEHGELIFAQRNLGDSGEPQIFDLIRVEVARPHPVPGQPGNWLIGNCRWKLLERPAPQELHGVFAKALYRGNLIFGSALDKLGAASFRYRPPSASLALLKPHNVRFLHEIIGSKKRVRALFDLGQNSFNLSVTDPPFEQLLKCRPAGIHTTASLGIQDENRLLFCASLGERFDDGNCHKLVAGVLMLPERWPDIR
jgi:hypothetical protein